MKARKVYEALGFERGRDPRRDMGLHIPDISWDNLKEGDLLKCIKPTNLSSSGTILDTKGAFNRLREGRYYFVEEVKEKARGSYTLIILRDIEDNINNERKIKILGSLKRLQNRLELVERPEAAIIKKEILIRKGES